MEELQEAKDKCEYPPRLQILYTRKDKSISLDYRFHVQKVENEKSEVVAIFPLMKTAIGNMHIFRYFVYLAIPVTFLFLRQLQ